jgi:cyanophycinase
VSIHLVGGGWAPDEPGLYDLFVAEAAVRGRAVGRDVPRVGVLVVVADDSPSEEWRTGFPALIASGGRCEVVTTVVEAGDVFDTRVLSDVDGLVVGGGLTPAYLEAVAPLVDQVRLLVSDGLPYVGFSAGAAIAADRALLGGWLIGDVPVCPQDAAEDLDEVELGEGLGLVDLAVDVHAAQWGTLTRLVAATEAGMVRGGVAIDEHTALVVGEGALTVLGRGSVWRVEPQVDEQGDVVGVSVGSLGAE